MKCIYLNSCQLSSTETRLLKQEIVCQVSNNWGYKCSLTGKLITVQNIFYIFTFCSKKKLLTKAFIKTLKQNIQIKQHCV